MSFGNFVQKLKNSSDFSANEITYMQYSFMGELDCIGINI